MRVFVTGASGFIGSAVVRELLHASHEVVGLARSDAAAAVVANAGATPVRGDLADLDGLRRAAAAADGVIHTAYVHDFSQMAQAAETDRCAIEAMASALEETGRPLVITTATGFVNPGRVASETDRVDPTAPPHPRLAIEQFVVALADAGVRTAIVRPGASVHGEGDRGFVATLIDITRERGVSAYIGDGTNRWPAVHRLDAARLYRLALERGAAASVYHAVAESVPTRAIAETIGRQLDVPVISIAPEAADEHFGWIGAFFAADAPASHALTSEWLGWEPGEIGLIEDLNGSHYYTEPRSAAA